MNRDLNNIIPGASNFKYKELIYSEYAIRKDILNLPNEEQWLNLEKLAINILQPVRTAFGPLHVTSAFRSSKLNNEIGGSKNSYHLQGMAADIELFNPDIKFIDIVEFIYYNLNYAEMIAEYWPNGWIHIAYCPFKNIREIKIKDNKHNYTVVTLEELEEYAKNL